MKANADFMPERFIKYNQGGGQVVFLAKASNDDAEKFEFRSVEVTDFTEKSIYDAVMSEKYSVDELVTIDKNDEEYKYWIKLIDQICKGIYKDSDLEPFKIKNTRSLNDKNFKNKR